MSDQTMADDINTAINSGGYVIVPEKAVDGTGKDAIYVYMTYNSNGNQAWKIAGGLNGGWLGIIGFIGAVIDDPAILLPVCGKDFASTRNASFDTTMDVLTTMLGKFLALFSASIYAGKRLKPYGYRTIFWVIEMAWYWKTVHNVSVLATISRFVGTIIVPIIFATIIKVTLGIRALITGVYIGSTIGALFCRKKK